MSYDILHDVEKDAYVLIDSELGRALGPVLSGPDAGAVLEAFVGALGIDPAKLEHWEIQTRFNQYLEALQSDVEHEHAPPAEDPAGEVVVPTADPPAASPPPSGTTSDPATDGAVRSAEAEAAAAGGEPPAPAPADPDPTADRAPGDTAVPSSAAPAEPLDVAGGEPAPGGGAPTAPREESSGGSGSGDSSATEPTRPTVEPGKVTCPECEGWGTVARSGAVVNCTLCEGSGGVTPEQASAFAEGERAA